MTYLKTRCPSTLIVFFLFFLIFSSNAEAKSPYIGNLTVLNTSKGLYVNATLLNGFTRKVLEAIQSGAPVTIQYEIELKRRRALLADENIVKKVLQREVTYNSLKKIYKFSNIMGTRNESKALKKVREVRDKMVQLRNLFVISPNYLKPNEEYYIRVRGKMNAESFWFPFNYILFFIDFLNFETPWAESTTIVINKFPVTRKPGQK